MGFKQKWPRNPSRGPALQEPAWELGDGSGMFHTKTEFQDSSGPGMPQSLGPAPDGAASKGRRTSFVSSRPLSASVLPTCSPCPLALFHGNERQSDLENSVPLITWGAVSGPSVRALPQPIPHLIIRERWPSRMQHLGSSP